MKLTKTQIKEKRSELVDVLLKIEKLKDQKTSIEKILAPDFETNEAAYRNGVVTENGILIRKASWKCTAKPIVEAAEIINHGIHGTHGKILTQRRRGAEILSIR